MKQSFSRFFLAALAGLTFTLASGAVSAAKNVDIGDARALPLGTTVTIKGTVTVPSGAFSSSMFDNGFAVQDKRGGIYASIAADPGLELGAQVEVTGQLGDSFGLLILQVSGAADVRQKGKHGKKIKPEEVGTGNVNETTEGQLVAIEGVVTGPVVNDLPYGYVVNVNDGSGEVRVFVSASTGIDLSGLSLGQHVSIVGFSSQFDTRYEVQPRGPDDITILP